MAAISAGSFATFSCEDIPVSEEFPAELKVALCTQCGSEIDATIACSIGEFNAGSNDARRIESCAECGEELAEEDLEAEEEQPEVAVDVWCPYVQAMDEVQQSCQEAVACMEASCGACSPVFQEMLTCVTAEVVGCEICALADDAGADMRFEIA